MYIIIYTKYPSLVRSYKNIAKRQKSEVRFRQSWGSVLLIIFYVENLDVGSWGVKNDV